MKKIIFVLPLLAMMVVGCSNPTNTETPEEKKTVQTPVETPLEPETPSEPEIPTEPEIPETPVVPEEPETPVQPEQPQEPEEPVVQEDKSPYEYVLPNGVDYNDYTYVGDYVFSDLYNFANCVWFNGTANSEYGYFMILEKIARVRYNGDNDEIFLLYDWDTGNEIPFEKGTTYKVYLKPEYIQAQKESGKLRVFTSYGTTRDKNPDCNVFQVRANNYDYDVITVLGSVNVSDFVAY